VRLLLLLPLLIAMLVDGAAPSWAQPAVSSCTNPSEAAPVVRPPSGRPLLFDQFIQPLVDEAAQRRATAAVDDPLYSERIDADLNAHRLNVALLGYGEEHDQTYADTGISVTILSLDLSTWDLVSISLSRDIRAPEMEDQAAQQPPRWPMTLRAAYHSGGFPEVRTILEDATGLSIDFQVLMKDVFLRNYLDSVSGPVELVVPKDFQTNTYRLDGVDHPPDEISAGDQVLSTDRAMTFVLGEVLDPVGKADERSYRKDLLLKSLNCMARQKLSARDAGFALNLARFSVSELTNNDLQSDFPLQLLTGGLTSLAQSFVTSGGDVDPGFPELGGAREVVVHDPAFGDGGVRRVHYMATAPIASDSPVVLREIGLGSLAPYMLIPVGGNPYATDLVADYWTSVRTLVKASLTNGVV
jgi:hypothetical protein